MDRVRDFVVIDPLEIGRGDAEAAATWLALNDEERHASASHLDSVGANRRRTPAVPAVRRLSAPGSGAGPVPTACRAADDAEQPPDRKREPRFEPGRELLPSPRIDSGLATPSRACRAGRAMSWPSVSASKCVRRVSTCFNLASASRRGRYLAAPSMASDHVRRVARSRGSEAAGAGPATGRRRPPQRRRASKARRRARRCRARQPRDDCTRGGPSGRLRAGGSRRAGR